MPQERLLRLWHMPAVPARLPGLFRPCRQQSLGQDFEVSISEQQGQLLQTGSRIRLRGRVAEGTVSADLRADGVIVITQAAAAAPVTARKVIVMLVDMQDGRAARMADGSASRVFATSALELADPLPRGGCVAPAPRP
jgi:hypothetical protein